MDLTNPDHAAFDIFLVTAANDPRKIIELYGEDNVELIDDVISHRMFNGGIVIKPPCFVSDAVTFYT